MIHKRVFTAAAYKILQDKYDLLAAELWEQYKQDPIESAYEPIGSVYNPTGTEFLYTKSLAHHKAYEMTLGREERMGIDYVKKMINDAEAVVRISYMWDDEGPNKVLKFFLEPNCKCEDWDG